MNRRKPLSPVFLPVHKNGSRPEPEPIEERIEARIIFLELATSLLALTVLLIIALILGWL